MTTLNDKSVADGNQFVLAIYYNLLLGSILRKDFSNGVTMSTDITLTDGDIAIQRLNCNGADRIVKVPPGADANHPFFIINTSAANNIVTVKSNDGATTHQVLGQGEAAFMVPDGNGGYKDLTASSLSGAIHNAASKATPVDADELGIWDSVAKVLKRLTWANLKATLNAVYDWATVVHAATSKATPVDADELGLLDSAASFVVKKLTWANLKATLKTYFDTLYEPIPGYIQENCAKLVYDSANGYHVEPGSANVNGTLLVWESNITRASLTISANTLYYVYLYSNSGTPALEESTTVPVWDSALNYYKKTNDATRRCIGFIEGSGAANTMRKFQNINLGRISEIIYVDGDITGRVPISGGTVTTAWTSFSLAPLVPAHATHCSLLMKIIGATLGDEGIIGLSPIDLGSGVVANLSPNFVRGRASAAGANVFFGSTWNAIETSQTYYYRLLINAGTPTVEIQVHGARFVR